MLLNIINTKKLLNSKWTAVKPAQKEKQFIVTEVEFDEQRAVIFYSIEAVMSKRTYPIKWQDLKDVSQWIHGWKLFAL